MHTNWKWNKVKQASATKGDVTLCRHGNGWYTLSTHLHMQSASTQKGRNQCNGRGQSHRQTLEVEDTLTPLQGLSTKVKQPHYNTDNSAEKPILVKTLLRDWKNLLAPRLCLKPQSLLWLLCQPCRSQLNFEHSTKLLHDWSSQTSDSLGYTCANFHFCCTLHCWASPWRNSTYSITHSPSLIDLPETEAFNWEYVS